MAQSEQPSWNNLNLDILKIVMLFIAQSLDGARDLARASSVSKYFKEAAEDKAVLKSVNFGNKSMLEYPLTFWNPKGLVHRCARAGNHSAQDIIMENLSTVLIITKHEMKYVEVLNQNYLEARAALEVENTSVRYRNASLALKELEEAADLVKQDISEILEQFKTFQSDESQ